MFLGFWDFFFQKEEKHAKVRTMNTIVVHAKHMLRECAIHKQGELALTLVPSSFLFFFKWGLLNGHIKTPKMLDLNSKTLI
jgi:hypothetical protein